MTNSTTGPTTNGVPPVATDPTEVLEPETGQDAAVITEDAEPETPPSDTSFHPADEAPKWPGGFQTNPLFKETVWGEQKLIISDGLMMLEPDPSFVPIEGMRTRERSELFSALRRLFSESDEPRILVIAGPSGTGKTFHAQAVIKELPVWPKPIRVVEYDSIAGVLDPFDGITIVNVTAARLERLPLLLLKKHIRPSEVVYFHAKPLSRGQIVEAEVNGISFCRVFIGKEQYHFFRDPRPPAQEVSPLSIRITNNDDPLLRAMLFNRFRHPDTVENGDMLEENRALNFQIAAHWFEDLQKILQFGIMDMAQMLHILHDMKDSGVADKAMPDARIQITAMRLAIALIFFTNREAGDIDWFKTLRWAVGKNTMRDVLKDIVLSHPVAFPDGPGGITGNFLYDLERVETLIQFMLAGTNKDILSKRDQTVFVFMGTTP